MTNNFIILGITYCIAVMSPGPSMAMILRNSIYYSGLHGVVTAIGTVCGISIQAAAVLVMINDIVKNPKLQAFLAMILSIYLFYLSIDIFRKIFSNTDDILKSKNNIESLFLAFKQGFLTDLFNPIALSFFLAIFSIYIPVDSATFTKILYWLEVVVLGAMWYVGLSIIFSLQLFQASVFIQFKQLINIALCITLLCLSIMLCINNIKICFS
jgi:threonine/homoserine/homoserine lactone efflux protein